MSIENELETIRNRYDALARRVAQGQQLADAVPVEQLGKAVRAARKNQGLTMQALSDLSGISYATLNKIETGSASVRLDLVMNVLATLGMGLWIG